MIDEAEFYERAAEIIRQNGLHKNELWPGAGHQDIPFAYRLEDGLPAGYTQGAPVCAWGAMYVAGGQMFPSEIDIVGKVSSLGRRMEIRVSNVQDITLWNDRPERTQDEVVEEFLGLAKDIRNEATP